MTLVAPGINYAALFYKAVPRRTSTLSNDASNASAGAPQSPSPVVQVAYGKGFGPGVGRAVPPLATSATTGSINAGVTFVPRI
jgi:hypothetical protein